MDSTPRVSERTLLLLLACVQFTHITDFMVMMPLGPQLMRELGLTTASFGDIISIFALAAGLVGLVMAPFADRFDRRKLLLISYAGFALGTLACGLATTPGMLMVARAICGVFGGVSGATIMTIAADVVPAERRARGMGVIMTAFSAAAALGVPLGLLLAQRWKWEAPFLAIAGIAAVVWVLLFRVLPPVRSHLDVAGANPRKDFLVLLKDRNAWTGIVLMMVCVVAHFMIIPFLSPYLLGNVGLPEKYLSLVYVVGGAASIFTGPYIGKLADRHGRFQVFVVLVAIACCIVWHMTSSGPLPIWHVLLNAALFFIFASGRFVPAQATVSLAVPPSRRGAYMSLISSSRDLAMGATAKIGGMIVIGTSSGAILHYDRLGLLAVTVSLVSLWIFRLVKVAE